MILSHMGFVMNDYRKQFEEAKRRYDLLRSQSQNPHTDPVLKSLEMALASLEQKTNVADTSN